MDDTQSAIFRALADAQDSAESLALVTVISTQGSMPRHAGSRMLVRLDGSTLGTIGGGAMEARVIEEALSSLDDGQTRLRSYTLNDLDAGDAGICGGTAEMFIEPVLTAPKLLIVGGGHVGKALAELALWAGFRVLLSDDREVYCNPTYVPGLAGYIVCKPSEVVAQVAITSNTYVAAVTRGLPVDLSLIPALLQSDAAYIGVIGSRRRWAITAKALTEQGGVSPEQLARIRVPIGLELEAETPKEIAVSILAEIIMLRRGGSGRPMSETGA
ncbi:MAG: XdhC family protein [Chloroflexi bacterium]|nr:XdhC family protein [Chloroflexota bacterium]